MRIRLLAAGAFVAGALTLPRAGVAQAAHPAPLDPATAVAIAPILAEARAARVPEGLLVAKARAGQVQRAPVAKIEEAVREFAQRLRVVSDALAPAPSEEELRAGADAVKLGVPLETLRAMRKADATGSLAVPIGVLTQLVARGVPVEKASVQVVDLLQRGARPTHFIALDTRVREDVLAGRRPDESLDLRLKGIVPTLPLQGAVTETGLLNATTPKRPR